MPASVLLTYITQLDHQVFVDLQNRLNLSNFECRNVYIDVMIFVRHKIYSPPWRPTTYRFRPCFFVAELLRARSVTLDIPASHELWSTSC